MAPGSALAWTAEAAVATWAVPHGCATMAVPHGLCYTAALDRMRWTVPTGLAATYAYVFEAEGAKAGGVE